MLEALIAGQRDPAALAELAKRRLRSKIPALTEALTGRFKAHHAFLARVHLDLIDKHTKAITKLTDRIEVMIEPFRAFPELITTIPGISTSVADVIAAETGADMTRFPSAGHLASWAGTCPGSNESAGRVKSTKTRPGNPYLKGALGVAAMSAARSKNTYLGVKYRRIAARRGPMKAIVAVKHAILVAIWNMARTGELYNDPGPDFYTRPNMPAAFLGVVKDALGSAAVLVATGGHRDHGVGTRGHGRVTAHRGPYPAAHLAAAARDRRRAVRGDAKHFDMYRCGCTSPPSTTSTTCTTCTPPRSRSTRRCSPRTWSWTTHPFADAHLPELLDQMQRLVVADFDVEHSTLRFERIGHATHSGNSHDPAQRAAVLAKVHRKDGVYDDVVLVRPRPRG